MCMGVWNYVLFDVRNASDVRPANASGSIVEIWLEWRSIWTDMKRCLNSCVSCPAPVLSMP